MLRPQLIQSVRLFRSEGRGSYLYPTFPLWRTAPTVRRFFILSIIIHRPAGHPFFMKKEKEAGR